MLGEKKTTKASLKRLVNGDDWGKSPMLFNKMHRFIHEMACNP